MLVNITLLQDGVENRVNETLYAILTLSTRAGIKPGIVTATIVIMDGGKIYHHLLTAPIITVLNTICRKWGFSADHYIDQQSVCTGHMPALSDVRHHYEDFSEEIKESIHQQLFVSI